MYTYIYAYIYICIYTYVSILFVMILLVVLLSLLMIILIQHNEPCHIEFVKQRCQLSIRKIPEYHVGQVGLCDATDDLISQATT